MQLIDTHSHLYDDSFLEDLDAVVQRAIDNQVTEIYLPNVDVASIPKLLKLQEQFPSLFYAMLGLHPCSVDANYKEVLAQIEKHFQSTKCYAVGEIGIDLYWDKTYFKEQISAFEIQIDWANQMHLPIVIHSRESTDEIIEILKKKNATEGGIFHCFSGNEEQAKQIFDLGFKIGIGGVVTFKKSTLPDTLKTIGIENIVLETDAPYLAPAPFRGKRNESSYVKLVAEKLSDIFEIPIEKVAEITTKNAHQVFKKQ